MIKMTFEIEDTLLGKQASYPERYDASLLFRIPRSENRLRYGIEDADLPFMGVDVLNCYEVSFLTDNGLPVSRMLKLIYAAESKYLVESKSLKLYLNSFNMERLGESMGQAELKISELIQQDLGRLLETESKCMSVFAICPRNNSFCRNTEYCSYRFNPGGYISAAKV